MAMPVTPQQIGVDVSKADLEIVIEGQKPFTLSNDRKTIKSLLRQLPARCEIALEATNNYHLELAEQAHRAGHVVFLINGFRLNRYREAIGGRAKTDRTGTLLLLRYLQNERKELTPWEPPCAAFNQIMSLLRRRAKLVQAKGILQQSLADIPLLNASLKGLVRQLGRVEALIERHIRAVLKEAAWMDNAKRCMGIEGVGALTGAALATVFKRGNFRSSDAYIAFLGLDVRVKESGTFKGKRSLTKKGDSEVRRLLYMAAMTARRMPGWKDVYQRYLDRGLASTQALNILARKIARIAFALMKNQSEYQPKIC